VRGNGVSVVCRSNYNHVLDHGYTFRTRLWGDGSFQPRKVIRADSVARDPAVEQYDYVILANKIKSKDDTDQMIRGLRAIVRDDTVLVSTQNGMGNESSLRQAFAGNTILSSVCNMSCSQSRPGIVEQTASITSHAFHLGIHRQGRDSVSTDVRKLESLVAMDSHFCAVADVHREKWQKLVFNTAWNSVTAIAGMDTHELLRCPLTTNLVYQLAKEAYYIGVASGIDLERSSPDDVIELARRSRPIITSSLRDAQRGRKVEIHSMTGPLLNRQHTMPSWMEEQLTSF
jgi:2-dehydropantoate 2-reductase